MVTEGPGQLSGAIAVDYRGEQHALGRTADSYAIWRLTGGVPIRTFALTDEGWTEAWLAYRELEPTAETTSTAATAWSASVGAASGEAQTSYLVYRGTRYGLGRAGDRYVIWDMSAGTGLDTFPLTDGGWRSAWDAYQGLESAVAFVPTRTWRKGHPIPLREMRLGQLLDAGFKLYRMLFAVLVPLVALVLVPYNFAYLGALRGTLAELEGFAQPQVPVGPPPDFERLFLTLMAVSISALVILALLQTFLTGAVVRAAADAYVGHEPRMGAIAGAAVRRVHSLLWVSLLIGLAWLALPMLLIVVGAAIGADAGVFFVLAAFVLLIYPGLLFVVRFRFAPPMVMIEDLRGTRALGRSWRLARGHSWRIFGIMLLVGLMTAVVGGVIALPFDIAAGFMGGVAGSGWAVQALGASISGILTTPYATLVTVLLYFDIRIRKEAFDLQLMAQQIGASPPAGA